MFVCVFGYDFLTQKQFQDLDSLFACVGSGVWSLCVCVCVCLVFFSLHKSSTKISA